MGDMLEENIHVFALNMIRQTCDNTDLGQIKRCFGGNNKSWVIPTQEKIYFLKHYFFSKEDQRDRLASEIAFSKFATRSGITNIPPLLAVDRENRLGLFQFMEGKKPTPTDVDINYVKQALVFIEKLNEGNEHPGRNSLLSASDACFSIKEHCASLESRFHLFQAIRHDPVDLKAKHFISHSLYPEWERLKATLKKKIRQWGMDPTLSLSQEERIISPSDFGFHNSIFHREQLYFIDFEYAGWDDPAKMVCDFFCQPEIPVSLDYYAYFVNSLSLVLDDEEKSTTFAQRVKLFFPLYRLKWCCIMLNDFTVGAGQRKRFASSGEDRRQEQLDKAISYYKTFDFKH